MEIVLQIISGIVLAFSGWLFGKLMTKREKIKSDFQLINEAMHPLLESAKNLTSRNNDLVDRLLAEQDKNLKLMNEKTALLKERDELSHKISELEKQIKILNKRLNELIKTNEQI
jgi:chromosome segregation ATPase